MYVSLVGVAGVLSLLFTAMQNLGPGRDPGIIVVPEKAVRRDQGTGAIMRLVFADDNKTLAAALSGRDCRVALFDAETGQARRELAAHPNTATKLAFIDKGFALLTGCTAREDGEPYTLIKRWDVTLGAETAAYKLPQGGAIRAISPDGARVATVRRFPESVARVWDIKSGQEVASLDGGEQLRDVECACFSPDGKTIGIGGGTYKMGVVHLWTSESFKKKQILAPEGGQVHFVTFSPKGDMVAVGSEHFLEGANHRGGLEVFDWPNRKRLPLKLQQRTEYCRFTADGQCIAVVGNKGIELWNVRTAKRVATFTDPQGGVNQPFEFSPDGKMLAGCSNQRDLCLWKVPKLGP